MLLLSLVGEQPIPSLLPLWQESEFDQVQLAHTETTESAAETIRSAIRNDPDLQRVRILPSIRLDAYDIGRARLALNRAVQGHLEAGQALRLNFTGGTKIMSLAAVQAAYGTGIGLMYVSTEEGCLIYYGSDGAETRRSPIDVRIGVDQYLRAHGLEVSDNPAFNPNYRPFADPPPKAGDALETKVEALAHGSGWFDDVRRGVHIRRQTRAGEVKNELDVVVARNARLVVCSCKAGAEIDKEVLYELASLSRRESAGIYCGKVLVCAHEVSPALVERARSLGITLVSGTQVDNIAFYLKQASG
jgi:hypothetical protein